MKLWEEKNSREVAEQAAINARDSIVSLDNAVNTIGGRPWLSNKAGLGAITNNTLVHWRGVLGADIGIGEMLNSFPAQGAFGQRDKYIK